MINQIYMLFDRVSGLFVGAMTILQNENVAKRSFKALIKDPHFPFATMVDDLQLFRLGSIDTSTGVVIPDKEFICDLVSLFDKQVDNVIKKEI